jgi:hypothetical protein
MTSFQLGSEMAHLTRRRIVMPGLVEDGVTAASSALAACWASLGGSIDSGPVLSTDGQPVLIRSKLCALDLGMECVLVRAVTSEAGLAVDVFAWYQGCDPVAIEALQQDGRPDLWPVMGAVVDALRRVAGSAPTPIQEAFLCPHCITTGVSGGGSCIPTARVLDRLRCTGVNGSIDCIGPSHHSLALATFVWQLLPCDNVEVLRGHRGRYALVVGVDNYLHVPRIVGGNCVNSAGSMASMLRASQYSVRTVFNPMLAQLRAAITAFVLAIGRAPTDADIEVVVLFVGHGVVHDGQQRLLTVDSKVESTSAG